MTCQFVGVQSIRLSSFRCFSSYVLDIDNRIVLICGDNGAGKSSLLEALYYACFLRSFRSYGHQMLVQNNTNEGFFIHVGFEGHTICIGCMGHKKVVKLDKKTVSTFGELRKLYRTVLVTEDDMSLVQEGPDKRRSFIDHALLLYKPDVVKLFRKFRHILEQRNALLVQGRIDNEELVIWTRKLQETSDVLQNLRKKLMNHIFKEFSVFLKKYWSTKYHFSYTYKQKGEPHKALIEQEKRYGRTLFGAHLDDLVFTMNDSHCRTLCSRGEQKILVLLLKIAQTTHLSARCGPTILLLDDLFTDLDTGNIEKILQTLYDLPVQLFITTPFAKNAQADFVQTQKPQIVRL